MSLERRNRLPEIKTAVGLDMASEIAFGGSRVDGGERSQDVFVRRNRLLAMTDDAEELL